MNWWWLAVLGAGVVLGAAAWSVVHPAWVAWRSLPRENRQERRRRRCRMAMFEAGELLEQDHAWLALRMARRAHRLDPGDPRTVWGLGLALAALRRYEVAVKCFEQAHSDMEGDGDSVAELAVEAARCWARLRMDARTPLEAEVRAEQVLHWARLAARADPFATDLLADDPLLRDLCSQVRLLNTPDAWEASA